MGMKGKKKAKKKRVTIAATVTAILSRTSVGTDEEIISEVRSKHAGTKFDEKHLAWYKSKFRLGQLSGMDGKRHAIAQKETGRKAKAKKAAKAKKRGKGKKKGKASAKQAAPLSQRKPKKAV